MTTSGQMYEAYALRFASWTDRKSSDWFYRYGAYDVDDGPRQMDCFFWLLRNESRTVLVDCGYDRDRGRARGRQHDHDPIELLARFGVDATDVDHVVLSHMHFDHIGNVDLFPRATFSVAQDEYDFWTGPVGSQPAVIFAAEPDEIRTVAQLHSEGRLRFVDESEDLFPGIVATKLRGHTPGQLVVDVATSSGCVVLASDALHYYEEMEEDRPFILYADIEGMYRSYDFLRERDNAADTWVVAGHDPLVMDRFEKVDGDCVDLSKPVMPRNPGCC